MTKFQVLNSLQNVAFVAVRPELRIIGLIGLWSRFRLRFGSLRHTASAGQILALNLALWISAWHANRRALVLHIL
jgi:hypothetical protein